MTLLEVLVAFVIFTMLVTALVTLATAGLETWSGGEQRKDVMDRAQRLLDQIADDVRNAYSDQIWHVDAMGNEYKHAGFTCDADPQKVQRLRFVRSGHLSRVNADPDIRVRAPQLPDLNYTQLWEIAYVMDADPKSGRLWRGIRTFDRRNRESILNADEIGNTASNFFRQNFRAVDTGILWISFRFWTPYTNTWATVGEDAYICPNRGHALVALNSQAKCPICQKDTQKTPGQAPRRTRDAREIVGPSLLWDSSRVINEGDVARFFLHKSKRLNDPDFSYPEIAQVTLVIESQASEGRGSTLVDGISESDVSIRVTSTRGMPDAPNFVKIDGEWVEYSEKSMTELKLKRRGARASVAASHNPTARVRFGETYVRDVHVPAYLESIR